MNLFYSFLYALGDAKQVLLLLYGLKKNETKVIHGGLEYLCKIMQQCKPWIIVISNVSGSGVN